MAVPFLGYNVNADFLAPRLQSRRIFIAGPLGNEFRQLLRTLEFVPGRIQKEGERLIDAVLLCCDLRSEFVDQHPK